MHGKGVCTNAQGSHYDMPVGHSSKYDASGNRYTEATCKLLCSNTPDCIYSQFQMYQGIHPFCYVAPACDRWEARTDVTVWKKEGTLDPPLSRLPFPKPLYPCPLPPAPPVNASASHPSSGCHMATHFMLGHKAVPHGCRHRSLLPCVHDTN